MMQDNLKNAMKLYRDMRFTVYGPSDLKANEMFDQLHCACFPIQLEVNKYTGKYELKILGETGEVVVPFLGQ